jgi:hypothetical protein
MGTPQIDGLTGDGVRMIGGLRTPASDQQPYFTSKETDGATWTPLSSPPMASGPVWIEYDEGHRTLYSANGSSGLWRMVTR